MVDAPLSIVSGNGREPLHVRGSKLTRRATMPDVAREAGVSVKTVSRVINGEPHVSPKTEDIVRAAISKLGFRRNDMARGLRSGQTSAFIGLVIGDVSNPFYSVIARAVESLAAPRHFMVTASSSDEDPERERELVNSLFRRRVDGLLLVPAGGDHGYLERELELGTPVVFLDRPPRGLKADSVLIANRRGAREGVAHLIERGNRRIAVVSDPPSIYTMRERLAGYRRAMTDAGIDEDPSLVRLGPHDPEAAEAVTDELLELPDPPTAFFATNNRMAVGVVRSVWRHGYEADVVGFDDFELADMLPMPLWVVAHSAAEMGRAGTELLFGRLEGTLSPEPQRLVLPTELVLRGQGIGAHP